jgi:predicted transposase YbfD/YdcC
MEIFYNGCIVCGWSSKGDDLEYISIIDGGQAEFHRAMSEAWKTPHVIRVTAEWSWNPTQSSGE